MDVIVSLLIYILGIVAVVFLLMFFHLRVETIRTRYRALKELIECGVDITKIDVKELFKL